MSLIKNYESDLENFLKKFDKEHPELSQSQKEEIAMMERIAKLRDKKDSEETI